MLLRPEEYKSAYDVDKITGDILVFLPGMEQISALYTYIHKYILDKFQEETAHVTVHRLSRDMSAAERKETMSSAWDVEGR